MEHDDGREIQVVGLHDSTADKSRRSKPEIVVLLRSDESR